MDKAHKLARRNGVLSRCYSAPKQAVSFRHYRLNTASSAAQPEAGSLVLLSQNAIDRQHAAVPARGRLDSSNVNKTEA